MSYDVSFLWAWLALAAVVGVGVGWLTEGPEPQGPWLHGWFRNALIVLVVAFVLAVTHAFAGRTAFWVESAVLFALAYLFGCVVGGGVRRLRLALTRLA